MITDPTTICDLQDSCTLKKIYNNNNNYYNNNKFGAISISLITALVSFGILVTATVVITPRLINAVPFNESSRSTVLNAEQQQVYDILQYIIKTSYATMNIVMYDNTRNDIESIVLWANEPGELGKLFTTDLMIIRHSRVLDCITIYNYTPTDESELLWLSSIEVDETKNNNFIDEFIQRNNVTGRTIATGVESIHLISTGSTSESASTDQLQSAGMIELTWISNTTDIAQSAVIAEPLPILKQ